MAKAWTDALFPGYWTLPNGHSFVCTPADCLYFRDRMKDMLAAGAPLPVSWEHQPSAGLSSADRAASQARNCLGHCRDARIGAGGQLQVLIECDDDDVPRLKRNKWVSPEIRVGVFDTRTGQRWSGPSIAHLAVTPRPVQITEQSHFHWDPSESEAAHLAQVGLARAVSLSACVVDLSLSTATYARPKNREAPAMPDTKPTDEDLDILGDADDETPAPTETPPPAPPAPPGGGGEEDLARMHKLAAAMKELGIVVEPTPGMDLGTFVDHVYTAVSSHKATKDGGETTPPQPQPPPAENSYQEPPLPETSETAPVMMSQAQIDALQAENTALKQRLTGAVKVQRKGLRDRIADYAKQGLITREHGNALIAELNTISLSNAPSADPVFQRVEGELAVIDRLVKDGRLEPKFRTETSVSLSQLQGDEAAETVPGPANDRAAQEAQGEEYAAMAGCRKKSA